MLPVICCRSRPDGKLSCLDEMLLALAAPFRRTEPPSDFASVDPALQTTPPSTLDRQASVVAPLTPDNVALLDQAPAAVQTKGPVSDSDGRSATSSKRSARGALERMVDMQATGLQGASLPTSGFGFGAGRKCDKGPEGRDKHAAREPTEVETRRRSHNVAHCS